jgi:hypothetical protein
VILPNPEGFLTNPEGSAIKREGSAMERMGGKMNRGGRGAFAAAPMPLLSGPLLSGYRDRNRHKSTGIVDAGPDGILG